jgi:2'-5' RNA ligase
VTASARPHPALRRPPGETAFVVLVPEAEPRVAQLSARHDSAAARGVPAHVTLLHPFRPPARVTGGVLRRAAAALVGQRPFDFRLATPGAFPGVVWLAPEPEAPFVAMTLALARVFPEWPPYGGLHADIVPHLTVAHGTEAELASVRDALAAEWAACGPVRARCTAVALLGCDGPRWRLCHLLPLRGT